MPLDKLARSAIGFSLEAVERIGEKDLMVNREELQEILNEIWKPLVARNLSWTEAGQVWDAFGEWIFSEGGKLTQAETTARMLLYVDDKRKDARDTSQT